MTQPWWRSQLALLGAAVIAAAVIGGIAVARAQTPAPAPKPTAKPVAAFVGDSYTAGTGASTSAHRWTTLVAGVEGWRQVDLGLGGTGYYATSSGPGCGHAHCAAYAGDLARIERLAPDVVVVAGGRNDVPYPATKVDTAIATFFRGLRRTVPDARIVVVPPLWDSGSPPARLAAIAAQVRRAAAGVHASVLDIGQPLGGHAAWVAPDRIHPNDTGHAAIASAVEKALQ